MVVMDGGRMSGQVDVEVTTKDDVPPKLICGAPYF
jgi:hypothetical protein